MPDQAYLLTALCVAAKQGDVQKVKQLISEGADPAGNWQGNSFASALASAVSSLNKELVRVLVEGGAKTSGETLNAMFIDAVIYRDEELLAMAERAGMPLSETDILIDFASCSEEEYVRFLLAHGAKADKAKEWTETHYAGWDDASGTTYHYSYTALHEVCRRDTRVFRKTSEQDIPEATHIAVAGLLLEAKAMVNHLAKYSIRCKWAPITEQLVTPLDLALDLASHSGNLELAEFLIQHGAKTAEDVIGEADERRKATQASEKCSDSARQSGCASMVLAYIMAMAAAGILTVLLR